MSLDPAAVSGDLMGVCLFSLSMAVPLIALNIVVVVVEVLFGG